MTRELRGGFGTLTGLGARLAEHPCEDRIHVLQVVAQVEAGLQGLGRELGRDLRVGLQQRQEVAVAGPDGHRLVLHDAVGLLAAQFECVVSFFD